MNKPAYRAMPGDRLGCFEIVRPLMGPDVPMYQQQFVVRACCCGMELVRGYNALRDAARLERSRCRRCADVARGAARKAKTPWGPAPAELPAGILPAAGAWPRPVAPMLPSGGPV